MSHPVVPPPRPTYELERRLGASGAVVGVDEVGRGAWAGPLVVGAVVTDGSPPPDGLADSKLLNLKRRGEVAALLRGWCTAYAIAVSTVDEIDALGMTEALGRAAHRALDGLGIRPDIVIIDGKFDYIGVPWQVCTQVRADQTCVSVAAASVLAKVHRDALMAELDVEYPGYGFADNVGYPAPVHKRALAERGPTTQHRLSWRFVDGLPAWRHLKRYREPADAGQLSLDVAAERQL